jgi:hypothetical protein
MPKWRFTIEAQLPTDPSQTWECGISRAKIDRMVANSDEVWLARLVLVKGVLESPTRIIQGWGRDKEACLVYIGRPASDYRKAGIETPVKRGMLFAVFVLDGGPIDHWTWRLPTAEDPDMPDGMKGEIIWPKT